MTRHKQMHLVPVSALVAVTMLVWMLAAGTAEADPGPRSQTRFPLAQRLLVGFSPDASPREVQHAIDLAGAQEIAQVSSIDARLLAVPAGTQGASLRALRGTRIVRFAEPDRVARPVEIVPNDSLWASQWSLLKTKAPTAWETTQGSPTVKIAVLDSGVDLEHPDLQGRLTQGYDFVNGDSDPTDDNGHGTIVAGIVGASTDNALGIASFCGGCSILPVKVMDAQGWAPWSAVAQGIVWATDQGASVINLSLGSTEGSTLLQDAVRYAHQHDVVVVAGAGNNGDDTPFYPAAYEESIATAGTDENDSLYDWSTRGPWVDVAAPGINHATQQGGGYIAAAGTSSSAAVVSGIAGLARSAAPTATAAEIRGALLSSGASVAGSGTLTRVDAEGTLRALGVASPAPAPADALVSTSFHSKLTPERSIRWFTLSVGAGQASSTLRFQDRRRLRVMILDDAGREVLTARGPNILTAAARLDEGTYRWIVSGGRGRFELEIQHRRVTGAP